MIMRDASASRGLPSPGADGSARGEEELRRMYDRLPAMIGYWDADLRNVVANQAYLEWFGLTPQQIHGRHFREVLGEELFALNEPLARAALRGGTQSFDRTIVDASGRVRYTQSTYVPDVRDGRVLGFQVLITDITSRVAAESARADETELLRTVLNTVTDGVICLDRDLRVTDLNAAAATMTGWSLGEAADRGVDEVVEVTRRSCPVAVPEVCRDVLATQAPAAGADTDQLHPRGGEPLGIDWSVIPLRSSGGDLRGLVLTLRDSHGARQRLHAAEERAERDPLTGLRNRTYLARLPRSDHGPGAAPDAVVFLDLDGFKQVNDTAGHGAGDAVLREVARIIQDAVRRSDDVVRMGGDEFAVLLHGCPPENAAVVAEQIVTRVREHTFRWRGRDFRVGASAGVARMADGVQDPLEHALELADAACYEAKRGGGRRSVQAGGAGSRGR